MEDQEHLRRSILLLIGGKKFYQVYRKFNFNEFLPDDDEFFVEDDLSEWKKSLNKIYEGKNIIK